MDTKEEEIVKVEYSPEETEYYGKLLKRLSDAKTLRDQPHDEFDGMTWLQYVEANRKGANTYIAPKKNKGDTNFVSGTIRQKMFAYLAAINNLDLNPDVQAYDSDNKEIVQLGEAMEDILFKVGELDNDEEKKLLRQYSLLEQGTVFVQETWEERWRKKKNFQGKMDGSIKKDGKWTTILKKAFSKCTRDLLMPENVYLGDIRQFDTDKQPYLYTVELRPYNEVKSIYGKYDRWDNVPRKVSRVATDNNTQLYGALKFSDDSVKDEVEVVKYQDKWNDEYMILLNGVMVLPVGFPLSAVKPDGEYTVDKQVLEPISAFFAFGKSLPSRLKNTSALLDEMYRMAILKTQKSFAPPMANNTGQVLSSSIFLPAKITNGIDPTRLLKIDPDARGVQSSEYNMLDMLQRNMDLNTVNPTFSGQQPAGTPTATQILEVQKQAKMMIGLTVFSCAQLEKKIAWSRINNLLKHWFDPIDKERDNEGDFINRYRSVNRTKMIEGVGIGQKMIKMSNNLPTSQDVMNEEDALSTPNNPVEIVYLNPEEIKKSSYIWYVTVVPRERKTDALNKILFDEMMTKAMTFPTVNLDYLGEKFALVWEEDPAKMFNAPQPTAPPNGENGNAPGVPKVPGPANQLGGLGSMITKGTV